ncbi:MAG TPA: cytidine deaminase [Bacteroidetes bacterium]|nr:cytidine deaminase [Bacteroidota bacterium]HIL58021.1 cytidine deaminase [Rhodothermales bacterium]
MPILDALRQHARRAAQRASVPFSRTPAGVALLLSDGTVVAGARIESASYPLTIPALQAAWARARVADRSDIVAVAASRPLAPAEVALLAEDSRRTWHPADAEVATVDGASLHAVSAELAPFIDAPADPLAAAHAAAAHAHIPVSHFPVGCVLETDAGWVAGANVEHAPDWTRGLCAERVALATALAGGATTIRRIWLACPLAPGATPCGGCRQLLAEHAAEAEIVIWNGEGDPLRTTPAALLPGAFSADRLPS